MGRKSQRIGSNGEEIAKINLRLLGIKMLEKIATPIKIVQTKRVRNQTWYRQRECLEMCGAFYLMAVVYSLK